jgi:hypothetical protein
MFCRRVVLSSVFIIPSRGGLQNLFPGLKATSATVSARPLGFNDVKKAA